jgi:hypothetical protein
MSVEKLNAPPLPDALANARAVRDAAYAYALANASATVANARAA